MQTVTEALDYGTSLLKSLTASALTAEQISQIVDGLSSIDMNELIENHPLTTSETPVDSSATRVIRNELNSHADKFNDELDRIKRMKQTLNQDALDPVINAARKIIHPVYNFTAGIQED